VKIVFLLTQDLESPSGLGRYAPLARELAALGHRVSVYALHPNFEQHAPIESVQDNLRVVYVAPMHVRKGGTLKTYYSPLQLGLVVLRATWALPCRAERAARPGLGGQTAPDERHRRGAGAAALGLPPFRRLRRRRSRVG
jgi:hypothetical protein